MPSEPATLGPATRAALRAVVTGSSSGIGRAIAERLLADGWQVVGINRSEGELRHARFSTLRADLSDAAEVDRVAA